MYNDPGDGMCCEQGSGSYKVEFNGVEEIFNGAFSEGASAKADFGCDGSGGGGGGTPIVPSCGNGVVESGEECDDGNTNDGTYLDSKNASVPGRWPLLFLSYFSLLRTLVLTISDIFVTCSNMYGTLQVTLARMLVRLHDVVTGLLALANSATMGTRTIGEFVEVSARYLSNYF